MTRLRDDEQCYDDMLRLVRAANRALPLLRKEVLTIDLRNRYSPSKKLVKAVKELKDAADNASPWFEEDDTRRAALDHRGQP